MPEELVAIVVDVRERGVRLEVSLPGELLGEVVAGVEVLEEGADAVEVLVREVDVAGLLSCLSPMSAAFMPTQARGDDSSLRRARKRGGGRGNTHAAILPKRRARVLEVRAPL